MIDCNIIRDLLPMYSDDALSIESKCVVDSHLRDCPECRNYYSSIRRIAYTFENQEGHGSYRYSEIHRLIRRRKIIEYSAGALISAASIAGIIKLISDAGKKSKD